MKKLISLILCLLLIFSLTACSMPGGGTNTTVCQHRDVNDDGACDKCSASYTDGKDVIEPCQHRDKDDDNLCDKCEISYSDGKDVFAACQHRDADDDSRCDSCYVSYTDGKDIPDTPVCQHRDANDDGECDKCYNDYVDGKDIPDAPVCQHRDADDDGECDKCYNDYIDGKDIPDAPVCQHRDADDDGECDKCYNDYTDGKDILDAPVCQHRDADDDEFCDYCGEDYTDGTDLECAHDFSDWAMYGDNTSAPCDQKPLYRVCSVCSEIEWKNGGYDNHSFQIVTYNPTCTAQGYDEKTCTACGLVETLNYTDMEEHDYKAEHTTNASFHWLECKNCDATTGYGEHTADDLGICTVCEEPIAPTLGIVYDISADGTYAEVIAYTGTATKILIADTYNGLPVKNICQRAFYDMYSITSVVIPDSVVTIGSSAFESCNNLKTVVIGNGVETIGSYAFQYCSKLQSITIESDTVVIGQNAFDACHSSLYTEYEFGKYVKANDNPYAILQAVTNKNLSTYTIHEDTKYIGGFAFSRCERLTSITIPDSVETLGAYAFAECDQLSEITLGESLVSIGDYAFSWCTSLTSVVIPDSVTTIGSYAFHSCDSLTSVVIPDSVTYIGGEAFRDCDSLTSVVIPDSVKSIGSYAFYSCDSLTSVTFENTEGWWVAKDANATIGTTISAEDLADASKAAQYLRSTYSYEYYWFCG